MPYDDDSAELAQMKAFLLSQSLYPKEATFDDGAYLLGQNPDMQQVALKIPKMPKLLDVPHNPSRRTMGLNFTPQPENLPVPVTPKAPAASPLQTAVPQPAQPAQQSGTSPLAQAADAILNKPMTRRQVLQTPVNAAVSRYGRKLLGAVDPVAPEMTPIPEAPVPMKTESEIANTIAKYADEFINDDEAIYRALDIATAGGAKDFLGLEPDFNPDDIAFDNVPVFEALNEIYSSGKTKDVIKAAKAVGLDIQGVARATGLSVDEVARVMKTDGDLLDYISENAGTRHYLNSIIDDGRPQEAYRSTSLESIDENDVDKIIQDVINDLGPHTDESDLLHEVSNRLRAKFFEKERNVSAEDNALAAAVKQSLLDDGILDEVYEQGVLNYDYMNLQDRVLDKFYGRKPSERPQMDEYDDEFDDEYDE